MRILIRSWSKQGAERASVDRVIDAHIMRIGRGTDQDLELSDLRIALAQAEIVRRDANAFLIAKPGAAVVVNGENIKEHKLRGGDVCEIGRFRLQVNPPPTGSDADFQLDVEELISQREERAERVGRLRTSLADLRLSRRTLAWVLFLIVILPALALPAWLRFGLNAGGNTPMLVPTLVSDQVWKPGDLSTAHAYFKNDCGKCHQKAFVKVTNEACLACHQNIHSHAGDPHLASLPAFAAARCSDCHAEHKGAHTPLIDRSNAACTSCHAQPQKGFPGTRLEPAASFSQQHPVFSAKVARYTSATGKFEWIEASQQHTETLHSDTNLKFPHDFHLSPKGIKSPGGNKVLGCADCHVPDASGASFKPVLMQQHCAECHRLDFDPDQPDRLLPHAQPAQIVASIRDFYARQALAGGAKIVGAPPVVRDRRSADQPLGTPQARTAMAWADRRSSMVIDEVFNTRTCSLCHTVQPTGDAALPFSIMPVAPQPLHRMEHAAAFNHAIHRSEPCASCHAADASKSSTDLLLPEIKRCRDCHGDPGGPAKIQTACVDCHGYHRPDAKDLAAPPAPPVQATATGTPR